MITGDFVNGLHLMVGLSTDNKPDTTSENTFFLEEDSGDVYYFSDGEWAQAGDDVAMIIAAILGGGSELPVVDASDNGKVLGVDNGAWAVVSGGGGSVTAQAVADAIGDMTDAQVGAVVSDLDVVPNPVVVTVSGSSAYTCNAGDNRIYKCGELPALTIVDSAQNISFVVEFTSGSTATVLSVPSGYKAPGGDLTPEASKTYELNVRNGKAVLTAFEAVSA